MNLSFLQQLNAIQSLPLGTSSASRETNQLPSLFSAFLQEQLNSISFQEQEEVNRKADLFLDPALQQRFLQLQGSASERTSFQPVTQAADLNWTGTLPDRSIRFQPLIEAAAKKYDLDPKLIHAVIQHESNYNPTAKSAAGAGGLMQLMPGTARSLQVQNIYDPQQNIDGGANYLRQMIDRYNGDIKLALAAYNAGPGNVDRYGGIPPFKETQAYVPKVYNTYMSV
ncbi:lytic transglycosylase domain-containing protein [Alkalihalobacillus oceani]|uniref:lytic transglycosylase domain-containing protein n=1 Tax=Halalkalibacter oceani TaxID=1653776 RepID=UPI0020414D9C|nr:lytic transglycosylase domain-containing protein [Halalkalibacter oceani]MCM3761898.1 lytic transglycosylase domain-containing protein [Halalkalibacter oceani]